MRSNCSSLIGIVEEAAHQHTRMSATDQFPPRYLLDEDEAQAQASSAPSGTPAETRPGDDGGSHSTKQQLYLPAPESGVEGKQGEQGGAARTLDVSTGAKVALDELGPMVVSGLQSINCLFPSLSPFVFLPPQLTDASTSSPPPPVTPGEQRRHPLPHPQLGKHDRGGEGPDLAGSWGSQSD